MQPPHQLCFSTKEGALFELSNFYVHEIPLLYENKHYQTSEHLYQSLKYLYPNAPKENLIFAEHIRKSSTPFKAKLLANKIKIAHHDWQKKLVAIVQSCPNAIPDPKWKEHSIETMTAVLRLKFSQDVHCRSILLSTSTSPLVEHSKTDRFWANGGDGRGQNHLGKCLMLVRTELATAPKTIHPLFQKRDSSSKKLKASS